jgi:hypothetical protein
VWLQGRNEVRLAAGVGAMGLTRRRPVCAAPCVVLTCSLPNCGAVLVRDLSVSVVIQKAETLTVVKLLVFIYSKQYVIIFSKSLHYH